MDDTDPVEFWESRYAEAEHIWSGRPNQVLVDVARELEPGHALDLGCGEGADAVWLAERGWVVTGVDISATALDRAAAAARRAGVAERFYGIEADLAAWNSDQTFDLIHATFLQSPLAFERAAILRRAAERLAPGGNLLIVAHAESPPWARHVHEHAMPTPEGDLAALDLPATGWEVVACEVRGRPVTGPDGEQATLKDGVVHIRRR